MSVIVNESGEIVQVVVKEVYGKDGQPGADGQDYQVDDFSEFTGELDVSGDFQPYNDYSGAEITSLSLSATKKRGATGNVRIKGGSIAVNALTNLGTVLPAGATISTDVNQWNEIDYQYLSDTHIRIILTVLDSNFQPIATSQPEGDTTAPTISSATIEDASPTNLVVVFSEVVTITDLTGLSISGTGAPAINSVSGSGTNTLTFVLASAAQNGDVWTLEVAGTNNIIDGASNALASTSQAITNNVAAASATPYEYFGLRKHNPDYTGPCLTVKADGGSTETNIGFDANGDLDTAAIAALSTTAQFRVTKLYGQYNGNILTQTTEANMPVIMNDGATFNIEGHPAMFFSTGNTQLLGDAVNYTAENGLSVAYVGGTTSSGLTNKGILGKWGATAEYLMMSHHFAAPNDISISSKNSSDVQTNSQSAEAMPANQLKVISGVFGASSQAIRTDGTQRKSDAITGVRSGSNTFVFGGYTVGGNNCDPGMLAIELLMYKAEVDMSADEAEMNAKYTIY